MWNKCGSLAEEVLFSTFLKIIFKKPFSNNLTLYNIITVNLKKSYLKEIDIIIYKKKKSENTNKKSNLNIIYATEYYISLKNA